MSLTISIALYFIIWWLALFTVLPFGLRTQGEVGEVVPGTPESAPQSVRIFRIFAINTVIATVLFALVWCAIQYEWVTVDTLSFL